MITNLGKLTPLDDWKREKCIHMPIADDNKSCITPDGMMLSCYGCRYYVRHEIRK